MKTSDWRRTRAIVAAAVLTAAVGLAPAAEAHGRRVYRPVRFVGAGFYGFPYYSFGWGPDFGPYGPHAFAPPGGIDMNVAMLAGFGAVNLNVKPGQAEVWVDGKYVADAKDLDGYPSYLWLQEGVHRVVVYKGGFARFDEQIEVQRGMRKDLKVRLEKGDSDPPGKKPAKAS
jgi:PEGA domain